MFSGTRSRSRCSLRQRGCSRRLLGCFRRLTASPWRACRTVLAPAPLEKNAPDQGAILFLVVPVVTVTFDNCYVVATMFPAAMPATVMIAVVLCTGTSILAIVSAIVAAIAVVSIVTDVNANSLGAHHACGRQSDNGRTNKGKFIHLYLH